MRLDPVFQVVHFEGLFEIRKSQTTTETYGTHSWYDRSDFILHFIRVLCVPTRHISIFHGIFRFSRRRTMTLIQSGSACRNPASRPYSKMTILASVRSARLKEVGRPDAEYPFNGRSRPALHYRPAIQGMETRRCQDPSAHSYRATERLITRLEGRPLYECFCKNDFCICSILGSTTLATSSYSEGKRSERGSTSLMRSSNCSSTSASCVTKTWASGGSPTLRK